MNNPNYVVKGKEKFAYGFVAVGSYMVSGIVSSYFLNYVTDILILKEWWFIIVLLLVGRISDMITDPLMGIVVDKTHTKAGKMRPYVKVGSFLIGIVAILMFFPLSGAEPGKMVWAMIMYVGFGLAYTLVDVPAMGMMSVATPDKDERAGLLSFYVTVGSIGGLLPTVLYMVLDFFVPAKWIYFVLAVIVGLTAFAAYLYLYFHSKERFATSTEKISVKDMMKVVAKNKPMVLALLMSMLASPRYMIMSVAIYISIYVVTIPGLESGTVLVLLYIVVGAGMFAGILLTPPTYKKFGYKKASLLYGAIGAVFLGCGFGVGLVNIYAALPFMTIGGLGLGAYNTLPYPMVGDSLDYLEWKTGERMEGICFSWNSFVTKFNNAVGALGVIVGLMVIGYVQPEVSGEYLPQTQFVKDGMFALATLIPAIGFALSLIPMLFYDYTGKRKEKILAELEESSKPCSSIEEWFRHIEEYTETLRLKERQKSMDQEGVRLMTLHAAKGLEFDAVWLIEAMEGQIPYKKAKTDKETEEERRLFYVGMTRAREQLTVCYAKTKNGKAAEPSRFVDELLEDG